VADTFYGSDGNHETANVADVELIAPSQKGNESRPLTAFTFNDKVCRDLSGGSHRRKDETQEES
jgi:hypothetical protein